MIVYVAFEFDGVDPDSPEADEIVGNLTGACDAMQEGFEATAVWIDNAQGDDAASHT